MPTEYELARERNIAANRALLASLGIEKPLPPAPKPASQARKRKAPADPTLTRKSTRVANARDKKNRDDAYTSESIASDSGDDTDTPKPRRSKRGKRKANQSNHTLPHRDSEHSIIPGSEKGLNRAIVNGRNVQHIDRRHDRPDPKQYGNIPGIEVGHWWKTRMACSADGVHAPTVGGISGSGDCSAYSVALSGGYEDDIDEGFRFTFTGSGGRNLKGTRENPKNLRTAPQSSHQQLTAFNLALKTSCDTGLPVRVIRGYKAELGPSDGYRYDGLYKVLRAWEDTGMSGFKVWRFAFLRIDGQKAIDYSAGPPPEDESEEGEDDEQETEEEEQVGKKASDINIGVASNSAVGSVDPADRVSETGVVSDSAIDVASGNSPAKSDTDAEHPDVTSGGDSKAPTKVRKGRKIAVPKGATAAVKKEAVVRSGRARK